MKNTKISLLVLFFGLCLQAQEKKNLVLPNENLIAENIADISKDLSVQVKKYSEARGATLAEVHPVKNEIIISTRFGSTAQFHKVSQPLGSRKQITFFDEPVSGASFEPTKGEYLIYSKDIGGNEFGQLFKLDLKTLKSTLLTDGGRSQNGGRIQRLGWLGDQASRVPARQLVQPARRVAEAPPPKASALRLTRSL